MSGLSVLSMVRTAWGRLKGHMPHRAEYLRRRAARMSQRAIEATDRTLLQKAPRLQARLDTMGAAVKRRYEAWWLRPELQAKLRNQFEDAAAPAIPPKSPTIFAQKKTKSAKLLASGDHNRFAGKGPSKGSGRSK